jgi:hypothetical protein
MMSLAPVPTDSRPLRRPRKRHGGREALVRSIRTITISILAIGLLAGSAVGVGAKSGFVGGSINTGADCTRQPDLSFHAKHCVGGAADFDDSRLTGEVENITTVIDGGGEGFSDGYVMSEWIRITNDGGSWTGHNVFGAYDPEGEEQPEVSSGAVVLLGEDEYQGLAAYLRFVEGGFYGIILEAEPE